MGFLEFIFGNKWQRVEQFLTEGAIVLDVRTRREWNNGHIKKSIHIPLDELKTRLPEIKKLNKPIITVCESGVRSASASRFLKANQLKSVNGGGWRRLNERMAL